MQRGGPAGDVERRELRYDELFAEQVLRVEVLASNFTQAWDAPGAGNTDRKRLPGLLVEDVTLTRDACETSIAAV